MIWLKSSCKNYLKISWLSASCYRTVYIKRLSGDGVPVVRTQIIGAASSYGACLLCDFGREGVDVAGGEKIVRSEHGKPVGRNVADNGIKAVAESFQQRYGQTLMI